MALDPRPPALVAPIQSQTVRRLGVSGVRVGSAQSQGWAPVTEDVHSLKTGPRGTVITVCDGDGGVGAAAIISRHWADCAEKLRSWDADSLQQAILRLREAILNWPATQDDLGRWLAAPGRSRTDMVSALFGPPSSDGTLLVNVITAGRGTWGIWKCQEVLLHRGSGPSIGGGPDLEIQVTTVQLLPSERLFLTTLQEPAAWWAEQLSHWGTVWPEPSRVASRLLDEALLTGILDNMTLVIIQPGPAEQIFHQCWIPGPFYNGPHLDLVWRQAYLHDAWSAGVSGRALFDQAWYATLHALDLEFARWAQDPHTSIHWLSALHAHQETIRQLAFQFYCTDCQR